MELSNKTTQLINRMLLVTMLAVLTWAAYAQFSSKIAMTLANRKNENIHILVLTKPAMLITYNPVAGKTTINNIREQRNQKDYKERTELLLKSAGLELRDVRFYVPLETDRDKLWDIFKNRLSSWLYNPFYAASYFFDYMKALHDKRTDITLAEFTLLSMDLSRLEVTDFTVKISEEPSRRGRSTPKAAPAVPEIPIEDMAPLAVEDRPLIVEILNASGKKGIALQLTQYLRNLNEKGLLRVDVLQYDNYPGGYLDITRVVDFSGRLNQVKQLSTAIGSNNEIHSEKRGNAICDVRIIIGKDFQMPLGASV